MSIYKTAASVLTMRKKYQGLGVPYTPGKTDSTYQATKPYKRESSSSISSTWVKLNSPPILPMFLHWMPVPIPKEGKQSPHRRQRKVTRTFQSNSWRTSQWEDWTIHVWGIKGQKLGTGKEKLVVGFSKKVKLFCFCFCLFFGFFDHATQLVGS